MALLRSSLVVLSMFFNLLQPYSAYGQTFQLGATWGPTYGFPPYPAEPFVLNLRRLGVHLSRITLYWSQLEPKPGEYRWVDLDSYLQQLAPSDLAVVTLSAASPWATQKKSWVFPSSPPVSVEAYAEFVKQVVRRTAGKVRLFQAETEMNNAFFWSGTADEYAQLQLVFYEAVKSQQPNALVVLGGSDGLFDPTGADPLPGQDTNIRFFREVIRGVQGRYDIFDLHLYGTPYTIGPRVETIHQIMRDESGIERPIISLEGGGPSFFEFRENRRWFDTFLGPGASAAKVSELRAFSNIPPETTIFLGQHDPVQQAIMQRVRTSDIVIRATFALSSGVFRFCLFTVWQHVSGENDPNTVMYGSFSLFARSGIELVPRPLAYSLQRVAAFFAGSLRADRLPCASNRDVYIFRITRQGRAPAFVVWKKPDDPPFDGEDIVVQLPLQEEKHSVITATGEKRDFRKLRNMISLRASSVPLLIE